MFLTSLMGNCPVVLFDEPTSGLDPESRRLLWNVMLALFQQSNSNNIAVTRDGDAAATVHKSLQRSCILTTHSLEEAEALCSRIAILLNGEIFAFGECNS